MLTAAMIAGVCVLAGCRATLFSGLNSTDQRQAITSEPDLVFDAEHALALDVYRPTAPAPLPSADAPVVVFFYGGDWTRGKRQWYRFVGAALAARGVVVAIPDYRKYPRVTMDGFMQDGARAVAWVHAHAAQLGADPRAVFIMGHSAGGQIAALLATDPGWLQPYGLQPLDLAGFIGLAGCYEFLPSDVADSHMLAIFGRAPPQQRRAQPVLFVSGREPPMPLLQGTADNDVTPANAVSLDRAMRAKNEDVTLKLYPGVGHLGLLFALSRPLRNEAPALADILAFIHSHLPPVGQAPGAPGSVARQ